MAKKILVCLDGSEPAERILPYALEQALTFGAKLILLKVCSPVTLAADTASPGQSLLLSPMACEAVAQGEISQAQSYLSRKARELVDKGVEVDVAALSGSFADTIVQFMRDNAVDLIAMTTHAYRGWKRFLRGCAVEEVLRESTVPMLVVNAGQA